MPKLSEVFGIERDRNESAKWNVIHLFKEGSFYHAYEWSAWLLHTFAYTDAVRLTTSDRKSLKVTHNKIKDSDDTYAFVGFPLRSIEKFIPKDCQISFTPVNDNQIDITIEIPVEFGELNEEKMQKCVDDWKSQTPSTYPRDPKDKTNSDVTQALPLPKNAGIMAIVTQILSYPLERKTHEEAYDFLSELKQQLSNLF